MQLLLSQVFVLYMLITSRFSVFHLLVTTQRYVYSFISNAGIQSVSLGILTIWSAWFALPGQDSYWMSLDIILRISIGNSMICSDIWHKYHEWYFNIVIHDFTSRLGEWNLRQFWNITSGIYAKYRVQIMLLFVYTSTRKRFAILYVRISN